VTEHSVIQTSFTVHVEPQAFVKRRLVSGPIWLEASGKHFPSKEWDDFPVAILGSWLGNLRPLILDQLTVCECPFMDGPYEFDVQADSAHEWTVAFAEHDANKKTVLHKSKLNPKVLIGTLLSSAEAVAQFCRQAEWVDDDLLELEARISDLKTILAG